MQNAQQSHNKSLNIYLFKISLVNTKNTADGATRFHCFQDGATMVWVSNQPNKNKPTFYTDKHPI
jgi:hypothetical protein